VRHFSVRVLVVDAHRDAADSTALLLRLWGYDVRVAYSGAAALELAHNFRPDVVLTELGLPGAPIAQVARHLPVEAVLVALTVWGDPVQRCRAREAGCSHYLVKPVDPEELHAVLQASEPCLPTCVVGGLVGLVGPRQAAERESSPLGQRGLE